MDPTDPIQQNIDRNSLLKIKSTMVESFYAWVLMEVEREQFKIIGSHWDAIIWVLFDEIANEQGGYSQAVTCIGELVIIWKTLKDTKLKDFLKKNLSLLVPKFKRIWEMENLESITSYTELFVDFGDSYIESIMAGREIFILENIILGYSYEGRQFKPWTQFLSYLFRELMKRYNDKDQRAQQLEPLKPAIEALISTIFVKTRFTAEIIMEMEDKSDTHPDFHEFLKARDEVGELLKWMWLWIGYNEMYELEIQKLHQLIKGENLQDIKTIIEIENTLFCLSYCAQLFQNAEEAYNINACLNLLFSEDLCKYVVIKRSILEILHIISEFLGDLDDQVVEKYINYVVECFSIQAIFEPAAQWFERMLIKN